MYICWAWDYGTTGLRDYGTTHARSRQAVRMESGEWRVESGEWRVESGEWRVESGEWRVESGEWSGESDMPFLPVVIGYIT